jgi:Amt family ammonium transporter
MMRHLLTVFAALAISCGSALWAEDPAPAAAAPAPAAAPAAAATPAPATTEAAKPEEKKEPTPDEKAMAELIEKAKAKDPNIEAKITASGAWFGTYAQKKDKDGNALPGTLETGVNSGDNAWMLISAALVLLMTGPGLALFYGGLVRRKNILGILMQSFALMGIVTVLWTIFGFSLAFAPGSAFYGDPGKYSFLAGVVWDSALFADGNRYPISYDYAPTISFGIFAIFQMMFAIITPALITGAFAERMKFSAMVLFSSLWLVIVYCPMAHMVWGVDGLFNWWNANAKIPAFDFAGGTVVHISSGIAALVCALVIGKRKGFPERPFPPHSIVLSFIGACMLWVGWFGFNAGSALGAGGLAVLAFANTQIATAAAAITWPLAEWIIRGKPTVLGAISGAVAGLVAITPACGFVTPASALVIGGIAGILCFCSVSYLKKMLGYDDALDAFGVHGVGGIWGAIATGLFLNLDVNAAIPALTMFPGGSYYYAEIIAGEASPLLNQISAVAITVLFSGIASLVILLAIKFTIGLRVTADQEEEGLDLTQHGEEGYNH